MVLKKQNADVIRMVDTVKERVNELKLEVPKGVQLGVANDFSIYVRNRISVLGSNLAIGLVLVVLVLTMLLPLNVRSFWYTCSSFFYNHLHESIWYFCEYD